MNQGTKWAPNDHARAEVLYSLRRYTKLFFDLLMDHPGERIDTDQITAYYAQHSPKGSDVPNRLSVAGSLTPIGRRCRDSGWPLPYDRWPRADGAASLYAMTPTVARLFRNARMKSDPSYARNTRRMDWSNAEVRATVADYFEMLAAEASTRNYSKAAHRRKLRKQLNTARTDSAIEYKHQNISAAMITLGLPYIRGYKPMGNFQEALSAEIQRLLQADPTLLSELRGRPTETVPVGPLQRTDPPQRVAGIQERAYAGNRPGGHTDYGLLQEENTKRGATGEQLVIDYERTWLREHGRSDLADRIRWAAREDGDGLGYDVLSYSIDGHERYIEVKTTTLGALTPFYLSSAELKFARCHPQSYALYRVYAVLDSPPRFFALQSNDILQLELTPVTYRACLPHIPARTKRTTDGSGLLDNAAN